MNTNKSFRAAPSIREVAPQSLTTIIPAGPGYWIVRPATFTQIAVIAWVVSLDGPPIPVTPFGLHPGGNVIHRCEIGYWALNVTGDVE